MSCFRVSVFFLVETVIYDGTTVVDDVGMSLDDHNFTLKVTVVGDGAFSRLGKRTRCALPFIDPSTPLRVDCRHRSGDMVIARPRVVVN